MFKDWKKLCRLCGYDKKSSTIQFLNADEAISVAVMKYFGIMISTTNDCTKICLICHDAIKSVIKFNNHVQKVNEMFLDFEENCFNENIDFNCLKEKYGLNNVMNSLYDDNTITKIWSSQPKANLELKTEYVNNFPSPNLPLKVDKGLNELNVENDYLEPPRITEEFNDVSWNEIKTEKLLEDNLEMSNMNLNETTKTTSDPQAQDRKFSDNNLECDICHKSFRTTKGKTIHLRKQHSIKRGPPFNCNTCGRIFKRFQQLKIHESIHLSESERKYYECPKCDKKFVSEWYVQDHIRIVHDGDRRFICELCGSAFGTNKNLFDHHLTHSEEKKFQCPKCQKSFKCKRTLKFHVETHDDTEYPCHICGLKLNTKRILRRHMLVHSDENKYKCNFCAKQFKRQYEFKNHLLLHTGLKLYQCSFCEFTFSNGSNCRKHQRAVHPIELASAESKGALKIVENVPSFKQLVAANEEALLVKNKT